MTELRDLPIEELHPNRYQPRKSFDAQQIEELAANIQAGGGLLQPIVVRPSSKPERGVPWEIVAGERRWRAYQSLGRSTVPCLIREMDDESAAMQALLENRDREDLNPIEEGRALQTLQTMLGVTQEQLAERVGMRQNEVSRLIAMTKLPDEVQQALHSGEMVKSQARMLLALGRAEQRDLARKCVVNRWSARQLEHAIAQLKTRRGNSKPAAGKDRTSRGERRGDLGERLGVGQQCWVRQVSDKEWQLDLETKGGLVLAGTLESLAREIEHKASGEKARVRITISGPLDVFDFTLEE